MSGILLDSYIANSIGHHLVVNKMRVDRMMDHPITYGIRMAHGAERLEKCLRKYLRDHPQEVFDMFRKTLNPVKVRETILAQFNVLTLYSSSGFSEMLSLFVKFSFDKNNPASTRCNISYAFQCFRTQKIVKTFKKKKQRNCSIKTKLWKICLYTVEALQDVFSSMASVIC